MSETALLIQALADRKPRAIARAITLVEDGADCADEILSALDPERIANATVVGVTGPPGAGKSTLTSTLIAEYRKQGIRLGIIAIDPSSPITGGALLGDRIRMMDHALDPDVIVRSMATRGRLGGLCAAAGAAVRIMAAAGCSHIIIETVGVGQSEMDIIRLADITSLVLAPGLGDDIQAMKAGLLEVADLLVVNKADCSGADTLVMDLEGMLRQGGRNDRVSTTVATSGKGVAELMSRIAELNDILRKSGEKTRRRQQAFELEVLDWAQELLRPRILTKINNHGYAATGDPRRLARELVDTF